MNDEITVFETSVDWTALLEMEAIRRNIPVYQMLAPTDMFDVSIDSKVFVAAQRNVLCSFRLDVSEAVEQLIESLDIRLGQLLCLYKVEYVGTHNELNIFKVRYATPEFEIK